MRVSTRECACLFVWLVGCLFICLFVCSFVRLFVCLFVCFLIFPSLLLFFLKILISAYFQLDLTPWKEKPLRPQHHSGQDLLLRNSASQATFLILSVHPLYLSLFLGYFLCTLHCKDINNIDFQELENDKEETEKEKEDDVLALRPPLPQMDKKVSYNSELPR